LFLVVLGVAGAYWAAQATSLFAVERVDVRGAPPDVAREIAAATKDLVGRSLVAIDADEVEGTLRGLPSIAGVAVDRAFPNTLVIRVAPERAVAVARRGHSSWLVTESGEVIREIEAGSERALPRLWLPRGVAVRAGGVLPASFAPATRTLAAAREVGVLRRAKGVRAAGDELTLVLRRGLEIRLGQPTDLALKLAVAAKVVRLVESGTTYVDVSVPERPVVGS
jgi:cell division septal protein FtsQ